MEVHPACDSAHNGWVIPDANQRETAGRLMKVARFGLGWNQEDLADALDVSVTTISQYERGRRKRFARGMAMALEEALGITDKALLVALGYEKPPADTAPGPGRQTLSYGGTHLDPEEEQRVLDYIDWIRSRETRS